MEKIIRVTGEGSISVAPDTIEVGLQINEMDKKYLKSLEVVNNKVSAVKKELAKIGIEEKNIITKNFSVSQRTRSVRDLKGNYRNEFIGYATSHDLNIKFDYDTKKLGEVVEAVAATLAEPELHINFSVSKKDGLKAQLIEMAVQNAKADAEVLASASGVKLGDVVLINHSFNEVHIHAPARYRMETDGIMAERTKSAAVASSLSEINVSGIDFRATVTIDFQIV